MTAAEGEPPVPGGAPNLAYEVLGIYAGAQRRFEVYSATMRDRARQSRRNFENPHHPWSL